MPRGRRKKALKFAEPETVEPSVDLDDPAEISEVVEVAGEEIPTATSSDDPSPRAEPKRSYKPRKKKAKIAVPMPPAALKAIAETPFLVMGTLYNQRTGRSLDFNNPIEVAQMHQASLDAFEVWMAEIGFEAPPWMVWAAMTSLTISSAITIDILRMKAAIQEKENLDRAAKMARDVAQTAAVTPNGVDQPPPAPVTLEQAA
jgi:hypothetical protein